MYEAGGIENDRKIAAGAAAFLRQPRRKTYPRRQIPAYTPSRRSSQKGPCRPEASREGRAVRGGMSFPTRSDSVGADTPPDRS